MMRILGALFLLLVLGCGAERQTEDYGLQGAADLQLTEARHRQGWAKSECFFCHVKENIHEVNHLNSPLFELSKSLVEQSGTQSCFVCHGKNGVQP